MICSSLTHTNNILRFIFVKPTYEPFSYTKVILMWIKRIYQHHIRSNFNSTLGESWDVHESAVWVYSAFPQQMKQIKEILWSGTYVSCMFILLCATTAASWKKTLFSYSSETPMSCPGEPGWHWHKYTFPQVHQVMIHNSRGRALVCCCNSLGSMSTLQKLKILPSYSYLVSWIIILLHLK